MNNEEDGGFEDVVHSDEDGVDGDDDDYVVI